MALALLTFVARRGLGEEAGTVVIHTGIEALLTEDIDQSGKVVRAMAIAANFSDHGPAFVLRQGIDAGLP